MRRLTRISATLWILSWFALGLEIFRWHHVTTSLRLNPPPPLPGTNIQPRPGLFLLAVLTCSAAAPLVFAAATAARRMARRSGNG